MKDPFINTLLKSFSSAKRSYLINEINQKTGDRALTANDLERRIDAELREVDTTNSAPISFPTGYSDNAPIDASALQGYYKTLGADIAVLLQGLSATDSLNQSHRQLFSEFLLKTLDQMVVDLEDRLIVAESLHSNLKDGFNGAFRIDFNALGTYLDYQTTDLLFDNYKQQKLNNDDIIQPEGGVAAYLPLSKSNDIPVSSVYLKFPESTASSYDYTIVGSTIEGTIDSDPNTFFMPTILTKDIVDNGAQHKITVELGAESLTNSIVIDPIGKYPFNIGRISYDNKNAVPAPEFDIDVALIDPDVLSQRISKRTIIDFEQVRATHVHITVVQDTYALVNINTEDNQITPFTSVDISQTQFGTANPGVSEVFSTASTSNASSDAYYKYEYGIADLYITNNKRKDVGFYISPARNITNCIALSIEDSTTVDSAFAEGSFTFEHLLSVAVDAGESTKQTVRIPLPSVGSDLFKERVRLGSTGRGTLSYPIDLEAAPVVYINTGPAYNPSSVLITGDENAVPASDQILFYTETNTFALGNDLLNQQIDNITVEYQPVFVTQPYKRFTFDQDGSLIEDVAGNGIIGIDENFIVRFYKSNNSVTVRQRLIMRSDLTGAVRLDDLKLLYVTQDPNKYRGI